MSFELKLTALDTKENSEFIIAGAEFLEDLAGDLIIDTAYTGADGDYDISIIGKNQTSHKYFSNHENYCVVGVATTDIAEIAVMPFEQAVWDKLCELSKTEYPCLCFTHLTLADSARGKEIILHLTDTMED